MMLKSENYESMTTATALRAIGQDLSDLFPLNLEVEFCQGAYHVRGKSLDHILRQSEIQSERIMQRAWDFLIRRKAKLDLLQWQFEAASFSHSYTIGQLIDLDQKYTGHRTALDAIPDVYSLAERLRIIGRVIDSAGGQLISLTKNLDSVIFQYSDCEGDVRNSEYTAIELYQLQQEFYSGRRVMPYTNFAHAQLQAEDVAA